MLTVSDRIALCEGFLPHWVAWMREAAPDVSLRLEISFEADIVQGLIEGTVDIGVMYADLARGWPDAGCIHIDWGPEFHAQFSDQFPEVPPPTLVANIGWLGVQQLLTYGGSGNFPLRLVRAYIEAGQLWRAPNAPQFKLPAWMVFPRDSQSGALKAALDGLRELARAEQASEK